MCEKHVFQRLFNRTREARALCGFQHRNGENLLCLVFSDPIIVGLTPGVDTEGSTSPACLSVFGSSGACYDRGIYTVYIAHFFPKYF